MKNCLADSQRQYAIRPGDTTVSFHSGSKTTEVSKNDQPKTGGALRYTSLTQEQRSQIAREAAFARWKKPNIILRSGCSRKQVSD
jgi:hypothetical protein